MRSYRIFIIVFSSLLLLYIIAELNKPRPVDWRVTLSNEDKNPYGSYILYQQLNNVFPASSIESLREPAYNLLHNTNIHNAAYFIVTPYFGATETDIKELLKFVEKGNYVFLSAGMMKNKLLNDTLGLQKDELVELLTDSTSINFVNSALRADSNYTFKRFTISSRFTQINKKDSTTILGVTGKNDADFVKISVGSGAFFVHAAPLCFSNYFMLFHNNDEYVAKALSYVPVSVKTIYWDEYYKLGRTGPHTPLRFFLSNEWLRWALRLTIVALIVYVLVEMKRRQRIIPVIEPLRNTTLDFVKTVSAVYLGQRDNKSIAANKMQYWLQYIRQRYYLPTNELSDDFIRAVSKKSGVEEETIQRILFISGEIEISSSASDKLLLELNRYLENFYTSSKI